MRVLPAALVFSGLMLSSGSLLASTTHGNHRASAHPVVAHAVSRSTRHAVTRAALHSSRSSHTAVVSHAVSHHSNAVLMNSDRATEIQTALIKAGYMTGEPTGVWDGQSTAAMQKMQGDNGWQTKLVPDSRALIKLGLGPGSSTLPVTPATGTAAPSETALNQ